MLGSSSRSPIYKPLYSQAADFSNPRVKPVFNLNPLGGRDFVVRLHFFEVLIHIRALDEGLGVIFPLHVGVKDRTKTCVQGLLSREINYLTLVGACDLAK